MPTNITTAAETNIITTQQMVKAREVDFVQRFSSFNLRKFIEMLGVTRKIPQAAGTELYLYTTTGTLQDGTVGEGELIPLSQYQRNKTKIGEITLKKWRNQKSAEAIQKSGRAEAIVEIDKKMLEDVQKGIRASFIEHLTSFDTTVVAATGLQGALAKTWGQLQVLFENDTVQVVHFINPLTIVPYLESATITTQTAFGLRYVEDFLGMGTVILSSLIPYNEIYSTAKENIIMYYIPMNGEMANEFNLTTDETGYIGTTTDTTTNRLVVERIAASGIQFLVEMAAGVVVAEIDSTPTLGSITVSSSAGTASGDTAITVSGYTQPANETYKYKIADTTAPTVKYGQKLTTGWTTWDGTSDITAATGKKITIASVDSTNRAQAAGSATVTAHA